MKERAIMLLRTFGILLSARDMDLIDLLSDDVEEKIKNFCNVSQVPKGLINSAADNVCGAFIRRKLLTGELEGVNADEAAVKSYTAGDISVTFEDGINTAAQRFGRLADKLENSGKDRWVCFRRLRW